jgi:serine/threonine-protein kinase
MATDERLDELRLHWQELQQQGRSISVAELCADCPELADALERKIETVRYWVTFLGAETEPEPQRSTPRSWGKFTVVRQLGEGGQASTLLVLDPDLRRHVVLKVYHNACTPQQQETVLREGQALARVRSPYVAQCYSAERQDGVPYLVVEYIPGQDLARYTGAHPFSPDQALELTRQLADGLAAVHACGLLHRDLKPANVLMGEDGRPRLVDFGLAVPFASEELARVSGTLAYMAPEQARGEIERIDARTDLFGLGAILYALLTGRPPYRAESRSALLKAASEGIVEPPRKLNPNVPRPVNDLCMRCLARDPAQRYASAAELSAAITRLEKRRWWPWLAAAAVLLLVLVPLGIWSAVNGSKSQASVPRTEFREPLRVSTLDVLHAEYISDKGMGPRAKLGERSFSATANDDIHVRARLSRAAYAYIIVFRPDGKDEILYPQDPTDVPEATDELSYPSKRRETAYGLTDGNGGLWLVALVASEEPLPTYSQWRSRHPECPWKRSDGKRGVVWFDDGIWGPEEVSPKGVRTRGERGEKKNTDSAPIVSIVDWLKKETGGVVSAVAFTVDPKK